MNTTQIIFLVITVVIWLISNASKSKPSSKTPPMFPDLNPSKHRKKKKSAATPHHKPPSKGLSFEELLKELRQEQETPREEEPPPIPEIPVPQEIPEKKSVVQDVSHLKQSKSNPYAEYNEQSIKDIQRKSNRDEFSPTLKVVRKRNAKSKISKDIRKELSNPSSVKKSIILSEIITPKYFKLGDETKNSSISAH